MTPTNTCGGGIDQTAIIGHAPEHRDWKPGDPAFAPRLDVTTRVEAYVTIDCGMKAPTRIGPRSWLLKHAHVGHDAEIGADVTIGTSCVIGGHARIGDGARLGLGAIVLPFRVIGEGAQIGSGAVVTRDIPAGEVWVGVPARRLEDWERDELPHSQRSTTLPTSLA